MEELREIAKNALLHRYFFGVFAANPLISDRQKGWHEVTHIATAGIGLLRYMLSQ
jgi:hypothetical protein